MTVERWIRVVAGLMIAASAALGWLLSPWWLVWTIFVGLNLFQFGLTGFCPMQSLLRKLGVPTEAEVATRAPQEAAGG